MSSNLTEQQLIDASVLIFCNEHAGRTITNVTVRHHRKTIIVTVFVNGILLRKAVCKAVASTTALLIEEDDYIEENSQFASCVGCDQVGPIENFCSEPGCEDSGNIYANLLDPTEN